MGYIKDITGNTFGRLTVISEVKKRTDGRQVLWVCKCVCGNMKTVLGNHLKNGHTKSCGCFASEESSIRNTTHGQNSRKNGTTSEYSTWSNMKDRCGNKNYREFHLYGGRGISVCERWGKSFESFFEDMGKKPTPKHSLDRYPNTNGDYCPENCRWATSKEQCANKRSNKWIEHNGLKMIQADWAHYLGTTPQILWSLLKRKSFDKIYDFYTNKLRQLT